MILSISTVILGLLTTSTATATATTATTVEDINRGDLYASCIEYQNTKWKGSLQGVMSYLTAPQLKQLAPIHFEYMKQQCDCTVTAAFKTLSAGTIQAYNKSLKENGDGITLGTEQAAAEFKKSGMSDTQIACAEKSMESSGYSQKLMELSK